MALLKKGALLTDIHFGKKSNSPIHNQDCLDFLTWFCGNVKQDPSIDYIAFLGDWNESRTSIDVSTINYSYQGAKLLNDLGLPVYFIVGNHDMGSRHSREVYSTIPFNEFTNFIVINEPTEVKKIEGGALFVPFLTKDEYPELSKYTKNKLWAGHFEFKGFVLTGYSQKLEHGPDIEDFKEVETILSGHFHKRQSRDNTHFIGNTFPMDFGDANDFKRGMAIFDNVKQQISYIDWPQCPKYIKCKLSALLDEEVQLCDNSYVDIDVDTPVTFQELGLLEHAYNEKYKLRGFKLDESSKFIQENVITDEVIADGSATTEQLIEHMLKETDPEKFDPDLLIDIFRRA
jgi:DNA repair exonuclease SbcCD nuclease subunit